jgi:hypothetical protein
LYILAEGAGVVFALIRGYKHKEIRNITTPVSIGFIVKFTKSPTTFATQPVVESKDVEILKAFLSRCTNSALSNTVTDARASVMLKALSRGDVSKVASIGGLGALAEVMWSVLTGAAVGHFRITQ